MVNRQGFPYKANHAILELQASINAAWNFLLFVQQDRLSYNLPENNTLKENISFYTIPKNPQAYPSLVLRP